MSAWLAPTLLPALIIMVLFAAIPRRLWFIQLPAVLGWTVVWTDNQLTGSWFDVGGLTVVIASAVVLSTCAVISRGLRRPTGGHRSS